MKFIETGYSKINSSHKIGRQLLEAELADNFSSVEEGSEWRNFANALCDTPGTLGAKRNTVDEEFKLEAVLRPLARISLQTGQQIWPMHQPRLFVTIFFGDFDLPEGPEIKVSIFSSVCSY